MKNLTTKQEARLEKKKKKMAALTEIIKLNDRDRRKKTPPLSSDAASNSSGDDSPSSATSTHNRPASDDDPKRPVSSSSSHEPSRKRLKRTIDTAEPSAAQSSPAAVAPPAANPDIPAPISTLDYTAMKRSLNARKRSERSVPKIRLKLMGDCAALTNSPDERTPIFLTDIQHLVMGTVLGSSSPCVPYRWCHIERSAKVPHVVVLVVEGCSLYDFTANESVFALSAPKLGNKLEIIMPADGHIVEELVQVPLTDGQSEELIEKYGSLEAAVESTRNQTLLVNTVFPVAKDQPTQNKAADVSAAAPANTTVAAVEVVPRTQLLLSALQLVDEGYPIPLNGELANRYRGYVMTKDEYAPVTATSPMFGLDCEMCRTSAGINELTRISIVNERYESVYETLVRPENKIIDYLTKYSGITGAMMLNVTKTRQEVQQDVRALLPADAILVGQSLQSDLVAMQMMHPYVIDTSCIFNLSGERRMKSKLQALSLEFLGEVIQDNPLGHDSIEDCSASLKLTQLKLARGVDFGDGILSGRRRANELRRQEENGALAGGEPGASANVEPTTTAASTKRKRKSTVVISSAETGINYAEFVSAVAGLAPHAKHIQCEQTDSNKSAVRRTQELAIQHDLTISHVRLGREKMGDPEKVKHTLGKLDRWIAKCWESVAPNGLFVVLMGGGSSGGEDGGGGDGRAEEDAKVSKSNHSGVVMFDIKPSGSNVADRK